MAWWRRGLVEHIQDRPHSSSNTPNVSAYGFDGFGRAAYVDIADGRTRDVTFTNGMDGQVIRRDEADGNTSTGDPHEIWYRFNGVQMGDVSNNGTLATPDLQSIQDRSQLRTTTTGAYRWGDTQGVWTADFDGSYDPINTYRQGAPGGGYVVQGGETLQSIAQSVWGDASLWYKIADANGLSGDAPLTAGQSLTLPSGVTRAGGGRSARWRWPGRCR